jgi:hypothetical protein
MANDGPMDTPRSNTLYSAIVATVAARGRSRLTVRDIAARVGATENVTAQCIALHRYMRSHADQSSGGAVSFPPPADFMVPSPDDEIDEAALGLTDSLPPEPARHA